MESATPSRRRIEQIGGEVFHFRSGKSLVGSANRSFGDIERRGVESPGRELLGIVAQAAANRQRGSSRRWLRMRLPKITQVRIGAKIGPRNSALPCLAFLVELLEPASRVAFAIEFRG